MLEFNRCNPNPPLGRESSRGELRHTLGMTEQIAFRAKKKKTRSNIQSLARHLATGEQTRIRLRPGRPIFFNLKRRGRRFYRTANRSEGLVRTNACLASKRVWRNSPPPPPPTHAGFLLWLVEARSEKKKRKKEIHVSCMITREPCACLPSANAKGSASSL